MTPEQEAATEMREKASQIAGRYAKPRFYTRGGVNFAEYGETDAHRIVAAINEIPLPEAKPDPRDAALAKAREVLHSARHFIDPYANSVFNDNGDMTVSNPPAIGYEGACNSYFLRRKINDSLAAIQSALKATMP